MALTDLLNAEYGEVSRDFTTDIVAHRDFPELLTLVYECRILSNPWLAAVTDEKRHARLRTTESFSSSSSSSAQALSSMPPSMCVADGIGAPSFAHHLRGMFNDTARAVRKNHGVASIVDPGTDPELDKVVGAVRSKYSRFDFVHSLLFCAFGSHLADVPPAALDAGGKMTFLWQTTAK
jgi:hypothetical protein